jgi:hypothetical protein
MGYVSGIILVAVMALAGWYYLYAPCDVILKISVAASQVPVKCLNLNVK